MTDSKKGTPRQENAPQENQSDHTNSTSFSAQTLRVRDALLAAGRNGLTSLELQEAHGVAHPPARIYDLREGGYRILTRMAPDTDASGRAHRVGRYFLLSLPGAGGAT